MRFSGARFDQSVFQTALHLAAADPEAVRIGADPAGGGFRGELPIKSVDNFRGGFGVLVAHQRSQAAPERRRDGPPVRP